MRHKMSMAGAGAEMMEVLHGVILAVLGLTCVNLAANVAAFRSLRPVRKGAGLGKVSILVPARDEARSIGACVESLLAQDYPDFELLVLDDGSRDGTGEIVRGLMAAAGRGRLIEGGPLPEGWVGKNWACQQLSQAATGRWLLFTDADTVHSPGAVSAAVEMAVETRADLFSAWPRLRTLSLGERLVIPVLHVLALGWFPIALMQWLQDHPGAARLVPEWKLRQWGGANGQFMLWRREAYERLGGHAAMRSQIVEDVAFGREVAARMREGMRLVNCDASRMIDCRMYRSFRETCDGFTKNVRAAFEGDLMSWYAVGVLQFTGFLLPFGLVWFRAWPAALEVGLIYMIRVVLTARMRTSWVGCALHPVGQLLAMLIGVRSWVSTAGAGVEWKGRRYRPALDRKG